MKKWPVKHVIRYGVGCLLLGLGAANIQTAMAEPSSSIQFLMREPVSMMDWGIKNIEDHLHRHGSSNT